MEGIWECERDPVEKSGSNQNPRKASGGKTMTMQWKVAAGVNELKCVSPSRNNNAQCHQQQCLLHTGCTLKCCNRNIGKLYPSVLYPSYISLEVWSVSIFELSTPSNTDPYLTNPLVPYKHQFLFSPFLSSTFSQSFHRRKNVIKSSIISCTEPFLATLVALHFTPVSKWVSESAEFRTSVASRLASLFGNVSLEKESHILSQSRAITPKSDATKLNIKLVFEPFSLLRQTFTNVSLQLLSS